MTQDHPITPPPELVRQWMERTEYDEHTWFYESYIATQAARWGADQELEACVTEVSFWGSRSLAEKVRAARRPQPPSLKEQALGALGRFFSNSHTQASQMTQDFEVIRRAVEQLDD